MAFTWRLQARRQRERDNSVAGQVSPELHRVCQLRLCRTKISQAAGEVSHGLDSGILREAISPGWEGVRAGLVSLSDLSWSRQQEPVTRGACTAASRPGTGHRYHVPMPPSLQLSHRNGVCPSLHGGRNNLLFRCSPFTGCVPLLPDHAGFGGVANNGSTA